jgi:RES domain
VVQAWQDEWFASAAPRAQRAWRGVEAQHVVSTMRLVDTLAEQAVLEQVLERSKPALPAAAVGKHYLLSTPFRYRPRHGSRFRKPGTLGIWYGAAALKTACAEVAYWRWRFLTDSAGLQDDELLTEHTFFHAAVAGRAIDLSAAPWSAAAAFWTQPLDYSATQALAESAAAHGVQWLHYTSVRDAGGTCAAVLDPGALDDIDLNSQQTWHCRTTRQAVRLVHGADRFEWALG